MRTFKKFKLLEIFLLFLLSLTPLLWYKASNSLALGHDMGYPLSPIDHFLDRIFTWTNRGGLGSDQQIAVGGFFLHGIEAFINYLGFSVFDTQKIVFIFWMFMPMFAMYLLANSFFPLKKQWFLRLFISIFYVFNHFNLQAWSIAERTKFSVLTAIPLMSLLFFKLEQKNINKLKAFFLIALVFFLFNGGGTPPFFGPVALILILVCLYFLILDLKNKKSFSDSCVSQIKNLSYFIFTFTLVNAYWIFPLYGTYLTSYTQKITESGGLSGINAWIETLSTNTTDINLLRFMGIPDWYDNILHPYSQKFLNSSLLILVSYILGFLVIFGILLMKTKIEKKVITFFAVIFVFSVVFASGYQDPFGWFYKLLINYLPGFSVFRTPFYKFGVTLWFAGSFLIAFGIYKLVNIAKINKFFKNFIFGLSIIFLLLYNYPFFNGSFFDFMKDPYSTMVQLPEYVLESKDALDKVRDGRVFLLPPQEEEKKADQYKWGYWSTTLLTSSLTNTATLSNDHSKSNIEAYLILQTQNALKNKDLPLFYKYSNLLGVSHILLREDYSSNRFIQDYKYVLEENSGNFSLVWNLGDWSLFEIKRNDNISKSLSIVTKEDSIKNPELVFYVDSYITAPKGKGFDYISVPEVYLSRCLGCDKSIYIWSNLSEPERFWPGTLFFPFVKKAEDEYFFNLKSDSERIEYLAQTSLKRVREIDLMYIIYEATNEKIYKSLSYQQEDLIRILELLKNYSSSQDVYDLNLINKASITVNNELKLSYQILSKMMYDSSIFTRMQDNIDKLNSVKRVLESYDWISDENSLKFAFYLGKSGNYKINLDSDFFGKYIDGINEATLYVDDLATDEEKVFLDEGLHKFELKPITIPNIYKGDYERNIVSKNDSLGCINEKLTNLDKDSVYNVSFQTKVLDGNSPWIEIVTEDQSKSLNLKKYIVNQALSSNPNIWKEIEFDFSTTEFPQDVLEINICVYPKEGIPSNTLVKDIQIKNNLPLNLILSKIEEKPNLVLSDFTFTKINNTKYIGTYQKVSNLSEFIILPTGYNDNWKLNVTDKRTGKSYILDSQKHLVANGYANGWVFDVSGEYDLEAYYLPQRWYVLGWGISLFSIIFIGLYILVKKL